MTAKVKHNAPHRLIVEGRDDQWSIIALTAKNGWDWNRPAPYLPYIDNATLADAPTRVPPPTQVAAILVDLVGWAADLGIALTHEAPEERAAIEGVRDYAYAWLTGAPRDEVSIADVLTTAATLLSAIELRTTQVRRRGAI